MNSSHATARALSLLLLLVVLLLSTTPVLAQSGGGYDLSWWTVDGGGAASAEAGGYTLGGTIGQPDTAVWSGGGYILAGGFWSSAASVQYWIYLPLVLRL